MSGSGEAETRAISVGTLRVAAGVGALAWSAMVAAAVLTGARFDGPLGPRVANGLLMSVIVLAPSAAGALLRPEPLGRIPAKAAGIGYSSLFVGWVILMTSISANIPWTDRTPGLILVGIGCLIIVLAGIFLILNRRRSPAIAAPIAAMTVRTARGDREVRIGQPEGMHGRWVTRWSVGGTPEGTIQRVSYGPDPMRSLTAALADAEAATVAL